MNYIQLKTGPGAVSGEEREGFCLKAYRKSELAGLYFPQAGKKGALQGLGRWIKQCAELERELERSGYQKNRKFFHHFQCWVRVASGQIRKPGNRYVCSHCQLGFGHPCLFEDTDNIRV